jgi:hypothetical protein
MCERYYQHLPVEGHPSWNITHRRTVSLICMAQTRNSHVEAAWQSIATAGTAASN